MVIPPPSVDALVDRSSFASGSSVAAALDHVAPSSGAPLKPRWEGLTEDQQLWEEVGVAATYCRGFLSPVLAGLIYHYPLKVLANLCSHNEVLVCNFDLYHPVRAIHTSPRSSIVIACGSLVGDSFPTRGDETSPHEGRKIKATSTSSLMLTLPYKPGRNDLKKRGRQWRLTSLSCPRSWLETPFRLRRRSNALRIHERKQIPRPSSWPWS
ncbi:hypothetical protein BHE74_00001265 [Ensete ventricosum]|nr:hypothetical protein BHE74_00001265 [Ensete ventricosum]